MADPAISTGNTQIAFDTVVAIRRDGRSIGLDLIIMCGNRKPEGSASMSVGHHRFEGTHRLQRRGGRLGHLSPEEPRPAPATIGSKAQWRCARMAAKQGKWRPDGYLRWTGYQADCPFESSVPTRCSISRMKSTVRSIHGLTVSGLILKKSW